MSATCTRRSRYPAIPVHSQAFDRRSLVHACGEILVILLLILLNGFFALSEMALVSAKRYAAAGGCRAGQSRREVGARADGGPDHVAVRDPDRHHAHRPHHRHLQRRDARRAAGGLAHASYGVAAKYAEELAYVVVVLVVTYVSLTIGELVPKRVALLHAETLAMFVAPIMRLFATDHGAGRLVAARVRERGAEDSAASPRRRRRR